MVLYQFLDRIFPRSYLAKVLAVTVVLGQLPLVFGMIALSAVAPPDPLLLVLVLVVTGACLAAALRGVLRPIAHLEAAIAAYETGQQAPAPLPEEHDDAVGRLMRRANSLMRTTETRILAARQLADRDPLTGLLNRRGFERAMRARDATSAGGAVLMVDLDHFKAVNDLHGHAVGDRMLNELATLLEGQLRRQDVAARFGGEEFVIYLHDVGRARAAEVAERLRMSVEDRLRAGGGRQTASVGVATWEHGEAIGTVLKRADDAVYAAKRGGRNRVFLGAAASRRGAVGPAGVPVPGLSSPGGERRLDLV